LKRNRLDIDRLWRGKRKLQKKKRKRKKKKRHLYKYRAVEKGHPVSEISPLFRKGVK
jgi:hypothetical protein